MPGSIKENTQIMKALADSSRLQIINSLKEKPQYVEEIAERIGLAISTVSFHLKKLEVAGLIIKNKNQYYSEFSLNPEIFRSRLIDIISFDNIEKNVQDERIEKYRNKVLKAFLKNGKLTRLPSQLKKRLIILEWFSEKFESGVVYNEKKVDEIIKNYFEDYCTVRRELIDNRLMTRRKQNYTLNTKLQVVKCSTENK